MCFIDGDSRQIEDNINRVYRLPGASPELTIFNSVLNNIDDNIALLTVACQRPLDKQQKVIEVVKEISRTNRDPHLLFSQVGIKLGFVPEATVRGAFFTVWIQENPDEAAKIAEPLKKSLDLPSKQT
jgi:hypothetical protein